MRDRELMKPQPVKSAAVLAGLLLACLAAGALGSWATIPNVGTWYEGLAKPGFTPPNWVFTPVWTALYIAMAVAAWLVWRADPGAPEVRAALTAFFVQLVLNAAWSWAFFGLHSPLLGLIVILALIAAIVWTMRLFWLLSPLATALMVPYLAWVLYACALNGAILALN
ncbi:Tryptophan-rich sensory protein [Lutibaculum baratangense AMV1]|uniref:Tryptophan-rich sensory protein n=1 Tax=Lutibaculum baratangense AMV1 TaxID=631454 RepID=V4RFK4_9HYPH|nr:Tryptophan-rich sensory protein [Lutibaculum baratangense AMV1]